MLMVHLLAVVVMITSSYAVVGDKTGRGGHCPPVAYLHTEKEKDLGFFNLSPCILWRKR